MPRFAPRNAEIPSRDGTRDQKRTRFDTVGDDGALRSAQFVHSFDADRRGSHAFDSRTHGHEQARHIRYFGFARGVL